MEHQFPDLGGLSDTLKNVAQGAQDIVSQGKNAVEAVKDVTLDVFKSSAGQVNQSLEAPGGVRLIGGADARCSAERF